MRWHKLQEQLAEHIAVKSSGWVDAPTREEIEAAREELERRIEGVIDWVVGDGFPSVDADALRKELRVIAGLDKD